MAPSGIEPSTFRLVAQHLNHCATAVRINGVLIEILMPSYKFVLMARKNTYINKSETPAISIFCVPKCVGLGDQRKVASYGMQSSPVITTSV